MTHKIYAVIIVLLTGFLLVSHAQPSLAGVGLEPLAPGESIGASPLPDQVDAPDAVGWYDGLIVYSQILNCVSIIQGMPYSEYGIGTYAGFAADPDAAKPAPGQVYYLHIVAYGLGNACSGQRIYVDFKLPANTSLAISQANPVLCIAASGADSGCPQSLPASPYNVGAFAIPSPDAANVYTWPLPQGKFWEFRIPVVSSTTLSNATFQANVLALDGNSNPWLQPTAGIYVFSTTPNVLYPSPSTEIPLPPNTIYKSNAYLYTYGMGGTIYFDLGNATNNYNLFTDFGAVPAGGNAFLTYTDWTPYVLQPNTTYHWRARFLGTNGQTYFGADQSFTTLPTGQVTVGSGAAASCSGAAFASALSTPGVKEIVFNCGSAPVTIQMTGQATISTSLKIDGDNRVTLTAASNTRHLEIISGGNLTLEQIALSGSSISASVCGGAIKVGAGGWLNTTRVQLINNTTQGNGGAICVDASGNASLDYTLIKGNTSSGSGGGVYNQGLVGVMRSDVSDNRAQVNGGGLWNNNFLDINLSLVSQNRLPTGTLVRGSQEGGGIYNIGSTSISTSTISGNVASYAAGIYNQNADLWLTGVTLASNSASAAIGGLESKGSGSSQARNTIIANNLPDNCGTGYPRTVISNGNNLDSLNQCNLNAVSDQRNTNPRLRPLNYNGGITRTMALLPGSPAIDTADNVYCGFYDQRGFTGPDSGDVVSRNVDGNNDGQAVCDLGAFEYHPGVDNIIDIFIPLLRK
jgi:hypothetical protein